MSHLAPDRFAALADEPATAEEAVHLEGCPACRAEVDAFVALLALARREGSSDPDAAVAPAGPPLSRWEDIAEGLRAEGLLTSPATPRRAVARGGGWRQVAAAAVLLLGGAMAGRMSAGELPLPGGSGAALAALAGRSDTPAVQEATPADVQLVAGIAGGGFASTDEAMNAMLRAQREYQRAAAWLAARDSAGAAGRQPDVLRTRLAALDELMPHVRQALNEAPQDPVLNDYYLATYDARESTLRQLGRALPAGEKLNGY